MTSILIQHGRLIDPANRIDRVGSLLIQDKKIAGLDVPNATAEQIIDARGLIVCPGLIDLHVTLGEPGHEEDETIATGTAAALAGGITTVACLPETLPVIDTRAAAEFITLQADRAGHCHVLPIGAVTKDRRGEELAEIGQLVDGGVVALSDGHRPLANAEIMRRALEYTRMFQKPIFHLPQVPELVENGVMHEGFVSMQLGLRGIPMAAEEIMVSRDLALAEMTGGRIHLMCLSCEHSVELVRRAKRAGVQVTADVTPHHLLLTDETMRSFDSHYKVMPPLRPQSEIAGLIAGLKDGTLDVISSDHQPCADEKKAGEVDRDPFGMAGLETLLALCIQTLIEPGHLTWPELLAKLTCNPARVLGLKSKGSLQPGADADVTLIDPSRTWRLDPHRSRTKSHNTPFAWRTFTGRAHMVIVSGAVNYRAEQGG